MTTITLSTLAAVEAHARSAYPEECCGILLRNSAGTLIDAIPAQNLATSNRAARYNLDPRAFLHAEKDAHDRNLEIAGFYHSHPDHAAIPSATDVSLAWETYLYLILPITKTTPGTPRLWQFNNGEPTELELMTQ